MVAGWLLGDAPGWFPNLFSGAVVGVLALGVPALARVINKRRGTAKEASVDDRLRLKVLEDDRDLLFDWLLGPKGFDGARRGGFMETDKQFKQEVMTRLPPK